MTLILTYDVLLKIWAKMARIDCVDFQIDEKSRQYVSIIILIYQYKYMHEWLAKIRYIPVYLYICYQ